jgi:hypothetical protein
MNAVSAAAGAEFVLQLPLTNQFPEAVPVQSGVAAAAGEIQPAMAPASSATTLVEQDNWRRKNFMDVFIMYSRSNF